MDFYLNERNAYNRLEDEFKKHGKLIIACDFDDTLFDVHKKNRDYSDVINLLERWNPYAEIIIWTGRDGEKITEVENYVKNFDFKIAGVNIDSSVGYFGRKVYANAYLDDRGGLAEVYRMLLELIKKIEKGEVKYEG